MQGVDIFHYAQAQNDFRTYRECRDEYQALVEQMKWKLAIVEIQKTGYGICCDAHHVSGLEFVSQNASFDGDLVWKRFHFFH